MDINIIKKTKGCKERGKTKQISYGGMSLVEHVEQFSEQ